MNRRSLSGFLLSCFLLGFTTTARAGGGPQNVLVVVNEQSADSLKLGQYYLEKRGIPERNLCRISVPPGVHNISLSDFEREIRQPIREYIAEHGLNRQVQYIALCMNAPTRVNENESVTASLFYGFKNAPQNPPCRLPGNTFNPYFHAERAFANNLSESGKPRYLVMMITAPTLEEAKALIDRGVASDGTAPAGTFYLIKPPSDRERNVRYKAFDEVLFAGRFMPGFPRCVTAEQNVLTGLDDVMGYMTGLSSHPDWFWSTNAFLPGAIADHMTSMGGVLPVPRHGQGSLLEWITAGATASYGTVAEPCAFPQKFPDPMAFFYYARGFNLIESYWMSVASPYQGLFVGEPLACPYVESPTVEVNNLKPGQVVAGIVTVEVYSAASSPRRPCGAVDYYVDDLFVETITNITPAAWNEVQLSVEGARYTYVVAKGDSLYDVVAGLARRVVNRNPMLNATPYADRLMLMDGRIGKPGTSTPYRIEVRQGLGPKPSLRAWTLTPTFLDGEYRARKYLPLRGIANEGDVVQCVFSLYGGNTTTTRVEATEGEDAYLVLSRFAEVINADPVLRGTNGVQATDLKGGGENAEFSLAAREAGPQGAGITIKYMVTPAGKDGGLGTVVNYEGRLKDTMDLLSSRGMIQFACGKEELETSFTIDTTEYPDGPHTLRVVTRDGTAVQTQGHLLLPLVFRNRAKTR